MKSTTMRSFSLEAAHEAEPEGSEARMLPAGARERTGPRISVSQIQGIETLGDSFLCIGATASSESRCCALLLFNLKLGV